MASFAWKPFHFVVEVEMKYIFLTEQFYIDYAHCAEIEKKRERPYVQVYVNLHGVDFAIPMRSNITHKHVFWTDRVNKCGLDFSKAVVIVNESYIDTTNVPYIRPSEYAALLGKEYLVAQKLVKYIEKYKIAKTKLTADDKRRLVQYSTLQYFEQYI